LEIHLQFSVLRVMSVCIVYLASPRNFTVYGIRRYDVLRKSLAITRKCLPNVPVFVFHEDYTEEDIRHLPPGIVCERVSFKGFESVYNRALPNAYGYLMMCRFFSGVVQRHPLIQPFTHYLRLDDDSFFLQPYLTELQVNSMLAHDYVYRAMFREIRPQQSLYEFTMKFIRKVARNPIQVVSVEQNLARHRIVSNTGEYTGFAPYNNFHISSLRLWNHPIVRRYVDDVEASMGILHLGWLDANIHAMIVFAVSRVCSNMSIMPCTFFGYRHNHHVCEIGSLVATCDMSIPFCPDDDTSETLESQTEETKSY